MVVVGGGYGGVAAAMKLKDHCNLTLIDSRNSFHHNMGAQRSSVEPGLWGNFFIPQGFLMSLWISRAYTLLT